MYLELKSEQNSLYMQLYQAIKEKIIHGELEKNFKLPSLRQMMREYKISKNTVIDAYYQLEMEGYIRAVEKKGFYVNEIENILISNEDRHKYDKPPAPQVEYDFTMGGVDGSSFPFSIWRKIYCEMIHQDPTSLLRSAESKGDFKLRVEIAKYLNGSRGLHVGPQEIIISAGTENLFGFISKLFDEEAVYGFETPGYVWGTPFFFKSIKHSVPIHLDEEGVKMEELDRHKVKICLVTPAHQFPTGIVMSVNRRIQLLNRCEKEDAYIIEDDYDGEFKYKGRPVAALKSMDVNDRVIYMGTFSKSLSPALRISYMVLPKSLMEKYNQQFEGYSCSCSTLVQKVLTEFMARGYFEKHINRMRTIYAKKYELCESLLTRLDGVEVNTPESGNSFILKMNKISSLEDFLKKCEENSIKILPVNTYRYTSTEDKDLIFGFAKTPMEDLEQGILKLSRM